MATSEGSGPATPRNPEDRPTIQAHRHAEIIEALGRINIGLEALNNLMERQTRLTAELGAKCETGLRYFVEAWQQSRRG